MSFMQARAALTATVLVCAAATSSCSPADNPSPAKIASSAVRSRPGRKPRVLHHLEQAAAGLYFVSESDFPIEVVHFRSPRGVPTAAGIASVTGRPAGEPVVEQTVDELFSTATTAAPWHSPEEQEIVRRFQALVRILQTELRNPRVFRFGEIDIDVYVIGTTSAGDWTGVSTHLVQT